MNDSVAASRDYVPVEYVDDVVSSDWSSNGVRGERGNALHVDVLTGLVVADKRAFEMWIGTYF